MIEIKQGMLLAQGRYELKTCLGKGSQGEVWEARQVGLGGFSKEVVLKLLVTEEQEDLAEQRQMLLNEARLAALIDHPNVVKIYECGEDQDFLYIAMERVQGQDLVQILERCGHLPWHLAVFLIGELCLGLHHAHQLRSPDGRPLYLVHRDLKPSNILVDREGYVKLIDFGIAKSQQNVVKTQAGVLKGTPAYMSPEQLHGRPVDARADLFSLGVVLFQLCSGSLPFEGENMFTIMASMMTKPARSLREIRPECPVALEFVLRRLLEKDPKDRFQDAKELRQKLDSLLHSSGHYLAASDLADFYADLMRNSAPSLAHDMTGTVEPIDNTKTDVLETIAAKEFLVQQKILAASQSLQKLPLSPPPALPPSPPASPSPSVSGAYSLSASEPAPVSFEPLSSSGSPLLSKLPRPVLFALLGLMILLCVLLGIWAGRSFFSPPRRPLPHKRPDAPSLPNKGQDVPSIPTKRPDAPSLPHKGSDAPSLPDQRPDDPSVPPPPERPLKPPEFRPRTRPLQRKPKKAAKDEAED